MLVYSIVVTYNAAKWLDRCLGSLLNSETETKILVVDNNSTDGTIELIKEKFPTIEVIKCNDNLGFGKANNIGLQRALLHNADYYFLLNQDCWVEPDTIRKLIAVHSPLYGILSPIHLNGSGNNFDSAFSGYFMNNLNRDMLFEMYHCNLKPVYEIHYVNAAAWLLSKKCIDIVGGFDPDFFMYGEDDNYLQRAKYFGFRIGLCTIARIYHDREFRVDTKWGGAYEARTILAVSLKDINQSFQKKVMQFVSLQVNSCLKNLLRLKIKKAVFDMKIFVITILSLKKLKKSRSKAKEKRAFL